jgi:methionyl-tRNA formyltransferase
MKPRVIVLGEKPQGVSWLKMLIESDLFDIIGGVPRKGYKNAWWGSDEFELILKDQKISIFRRDDIKNLDYDIIWSLMYGYIIDPFLIKKARWFGLNLHESPLPRFRGCNGFSHSIIENDITYGTTFQILGKELDSGGIIDQEIFPIMVDETSKELYERTKAISNIVFKRNMERISQRNFSVRSINVENEEIRNRSSLSEMKDLSRYSGNSFRNIVRALDFIPFEPAYSWEGGKKFYYFINNSYNRLHHPGGPRLIIKMQEDEYKQIYPLFIPEYSWLK